MPHTPQHLATNLSAKSKCRASGGVWDEATQTCKSRRQVAEEKARAEQEKASFRPKTESRAPDSFLPPKPKDPFTPAPKTSTADPNQAPLKPTNQKLTDEERANANGVIITDVDGNERIQTREDVERLQDKTAFNQSLGGGLSAAEGIQLQEQIEQIAQQGAGLGAQVGQFDELGISPTGFDTGSIGGAIGQGIIPGLIRGVSSGIGLGILGAKAGGTVGAAAGPVGIAVVGALGFASGIASSILSEMRGQRTDNTNAQQRVLDEGKQILNDWVTFAEANPSLKTEALRGFNNQLALIDQAHRQMKLDTQSDVAAFENAIPNLAEFNSFYSGAGERDVLTTEMAIAMGTTEATELKYIDMIKRRR